MVNPDLRTIRLWPVGGALTTSMIPVTGGVFERLEDTSLQAYKKSEIKILTISDMIPRIYPWITKAHNLVLKMNFFPI